MAERLLIDHVGHRGDGVAFSNGATLYVPTTLAGEIVEAGPVAGHHPERRHLLSIEVASPERIAPFCPHFGLCGGCAIQHWQAGPYQAWKRAIVVETLAKAGFDCAVGELIDAHGSGRRRITLHARRSGHNVLKVGFSAANSHDIIPIHRCPVLDPGLAGAFDAAWAIAEALATVAKPLDLQFTATNSGLDVDVRGSGPITAAMVTALSAIAREYRLARLTRHGELILQQQPPRLAMGRAEVTLPPGSFLQATLAGEETLAREVIAGIGRARAVADLFCGVGPFALRLAEKVRVTAIDSALPALTALTAASHAPGLKPVTAVRRDLFRQPLVPQELRDFDAVVFDPPRQGAQAQATRLAASTVPVVVAVSCNIATFARDIRILTDGGYRLTSVVPIDQFRHSPHVELVAVLRR
ncbi:MAG: methyltransferase [Alphaproteobacteria bacterium]|nr:methyltransferase [Alphaproteobacteria bacterium]